MATRPTKKSSEEAAVPVVDDVQVLFDEAAEKGYFGEVPDKTPNEAYTLAGVNAGKPTPETTRGE